MNFKIKKISRKKLKKKSAAKEKPLKKKKKLYINMGFLGSIVLIILLSIGIVKSFSNIDYRVIIDIVSSDIKTDGYKHTNILVLGTGGKEHEGSDLTDTILLASIDNNNKLVTMISIPRDTWVKDEIIGNSKINEMYFNAKNYYEDSEKGLEHMKEKVENLMGIPIHYYIKINFNGFKDLVNTIGGIDVMVEEKIYDPYFPKDGTFEYEAFYIESGLQHLDGETALKYARSRKTTSDFDRANRQQQIIYAIKEKTLQTNVIFSKSKIEDILDTLKDNIDTNITAKELLTLGTMASDYQSNQINHRLIHDDPTQCGGFVYSPSREFYNNQFVLIPAGGYESIHQYADLNLNTPQIAQENSKIHILNGTSVVGVAGETKQVLKRFCFDIIRYGNAKNLQTTETIYYYNKENGRPEALNFLQKVIPGKESTLIPQEYINLGYNLKADVILEIGLDYVNSPDYMEDAFYDIPGIYFPVETPSAISADSSSSLSSGLETESPNIISDED